MPFECHSSCGNNAPIDCAASGRADAAQKPLQVLDLNTSIHIKGKPMSFISQLLTAFIIFGSVTLVGIGLVIVLLARQDRNSGATGKARNGEPSI
jgi:hypothetical protein